MSQAARPAARRAADDEAAARFKHLIEPIRDLAKNWSVDVASELEHYTAELEDISFSADGGATTLNFAEAALLIQGSACIYSKKVEYLYELVFQAINFIEKRKKKQREADRLGGSVGADGRDADADPLDDDNLEFLLLDDDIPEADDAAINMKERDLEMETVPPTAYRPRFPWLLRQATDRGDGEYNLTAMHVHRSGALLLDVADVRALDDNLEPVAQPNFEDIGAGSEEPDFGAGGYEDDDDDFGGGGGAEFDVDVGGGAGASEGGWLTHGRTPGGRVPPTPAVPVVGEDEEEYDPFEPLDADDVEGHGALAVRPFRKGRTQLSKAALENALPALTDALEGEVCSGVHFEGERSSAAPPAPAQHTQPAFPEFALAFEAAKRAARALKRAKERRVSGATPAPAKKRSSLPSAVVFDAPALEGDAAAYADEPDFGDGGADFDDDDDDMGEFPGMGDDEQGGGGLGWLAAGREHSGALSTPRSASAAVTYAELVRAKVDELVQRTLASERVTELTRRVTDWRSRIEPELEAEEACAAFDIHEYGDGVLGAIAVDTATGQRRPDEAVRGSTVDFGAVFAAARRAKAQEAEARGEDPTNVGAGTEAGEIARTFAATLQLINDGALEIDTASLDATDAGSAGGSMDSGVLRELRMKVLNPHRLLVTMQYGQGASEADATERAAAKGKAPVKRVAAEGAIEGAAAAKKRALRETQR